MRFRILHIVFFLFISSLTFANRIDSLRKALSNGQSDSARVLTLSYLIAELSENEKTDAYSYLEQADKLANRLNNDFLIGEVYRHAAHYELYKQKDYATALKYIKKCIWHQEHIKSYESLIHTYTFLAREIFEKADMVEETMEAMKKAAEFAALARKGDNAYQLYVLGWYEANHYALDSAMFHLEMSYELNKAKENPAFDVELLIWMGNTLRNAKRYHEALKYHSRALSVARTIKDKNILADCYRYTGTVYRGLKMNDSAVYYLKKGADFWIQEKWHDRMHVVGANLVNWLVKDNKLDDAKKYVLIIKDTSVYNYRKNDYQKLNVSEALYNYYNKLNDYKLANIYLRDFVAAKDSISSRRIQNNINEQNLKLEFQHQQENFRLEQKLRDIELNSELKEEQAFSKMMAGMVIGFVIIIGYGFWSMRQRKKAFNVIAQQKIEVEEQKSLVENKNKEILDSFHYARRIQSAIIASEETIHKLLPESFVLFKPKDIVSGDFIWALKKKVIIEGNKEELIFVAVCDSTGHGVPGAFMSLLVIGFLTEAINEMELVDTDYIYNYVRGKLIKTVSKDGQKDGFDGTLLCFNKTHQTISYSSAYNSPLLISNGNITRLPADKMPVGEGQRDHSFTTHKLNYQKGDVLYLYTDGYADQFGGNDALVRARGGKKFKQKRFIEKIQSITHLPLAEQKTILDTTFEDWKGNLEQLDDVCVVGFRL